MYLFNTCVTGLVLKPNCTVQTFSCHCGRSSGFGTTGLGQVSVASCVTNGSHSKDVCSSDDFRAKCHEMQGLLQDLARFFVQLLFNFLSFSILLKSWTNLVGLALGSTFQLGSITPCSRGLSCDRWQFWISAKPVCKKIVPRTIYSYVILYNKLCNKLCKCDHFLRAILTVTSSTCIFINVQPEVYWLQKERILLFCGWQNLNIWKDLFVISQHRYLFQNMENRHFLVGKYWFSVSLTVAVCHFVLKCVDLMKVGNFVQKNCSCLHN